LHSQPLEEEHVARRHRLSREAEREIADQILELEEELARQLGLDRSSSLRQRGHTRSGWVALLEEGVGRAKGPLRRVARALWVQAQALRWRLAQSASFLLAREAHRLVGNPSMSESELVQEGWIGLLEATRRFEPDRGFRFHTYARWWALAAMTRAIEVNRLVRLPITASEQLRKLHKLIRQHEAARTDWTLAALAAQVGLPPQRAEQLLEAGLLEWLDEETDEDTRTLELVDEGPLPDEVVHDALVRAKLGTAIDTLLPERQRLVMLHRYGQTPQTRREIGQQLSLSAERVRQIEQSSIATLREACFGP
jgi:RNA polymerase sigma factor (sigma-70 family)